MPFVTSQTPDFQSCVILFTLPIKFLRTKIGRERNVIIPEEFTDRPEANVVLSKVNSA